MRPFTPLPNANISPKVNVLRCKIVKKLNYEFFKPATKALFHFVRHYCENRSTVGNLHLKFCSIRNIQQTNLSAGNLIARSIQISG